MTDAAFLPIGLVNRLDGDLGVGSKGLIMAAHKRAAFVNPFTPDILDFERPPVVETSIGFYFAPIQGWTIIHYGLLWGALTDRYAKYEFNPPLMEPGGLYGGDALRGFQNLPFRVSFVDGSNSNLVQVQNNFLLHNWRRSGDASLYQRYAASRKELGADWKCFGDFLGQQSLRIGEVVRCEISYFNHLVRGEDWNDYRDLANLFPAWNGTANAGVLSAPQMIGINASYLTKLGVLQMVVQPALRQDGKEILQLTATATGRPSGTTDDELFACLDGCHETAVTGFADFIGPELHRRWGRKR